MALDSLDPSIASALIRIGFTSSRLVDAAIDDLSDAEGIVDLLIRRGLAPADSSTLPSRLLAAVEASRPEIKRHRSRIANPDLVTRTSALVDFRKAALATSRPVPTYIGAPPRNPRLAHVLGVPAGTVHRHRT